MFAEEFKSFLSEDERENPYEFRLKEPINLGATEIKSLRLRPLKGREVRKLNLEALTREGSFGQDVLANLLSLAEELTQTDAKTIDALSFEDAFSLAMRVFFLLAQSLSTFSARLLP